MLYLKNIYTMMHGQKNIKLSSCCDVNNSTLFSATAALTLPVCVYLLVYIYTSTCNPLIGILLILSRKKCVYSD